MNYQIHITSMAERDIMRAMDYIEFNLKNPDAADNLVDAVTEKVASLSYLPQKFRLVDDPVCLSSDDGMSFEMEKVLSAMPEGNPYGMKASRILEINPNHEIFKAGFLFFCMDLAYNMSCNLQYSELQ